MQKRLMVALVVSGLLFAAIGCKNEGYEKCLKQANEYESGKIACLAMTDKAQQEACTSRNEVKKITPKDCADSYK